METQRQRGINLSSNYVQAGEEVNRARAALDKLEEEAKRDEREEAVSRSWSRYFASFIVSTRADEEARVMRERRAIQRLHARRFRERDLARCKENMNSLSQRIAIVAAEISATKSKIEEKQRDEWQRQAERRQEEIRQEAMRQAERMQEERRQAERRQEERRQAERRQEEMRQEAMRQAERWQEEIRQAERRQAERKREEERRQQQMAEERKHQEAAERKRQQEVDQERKRQQKEAQERRRQQEAVHDRPRPQEASRRHAARQKEPGLGHRRGPRSNRPGTSKSCNHRAHWDRIEGRGSCSRCNVVQRRFTFRCPTCQTVACMDCMKSLRGY